jgi:glycine/D-amino acid oxidase-like deaminating enzyme
VQRAITLWRQLEESTGKQLFVQAGVTYAGPANDAFMAGSRRAAQKWALALPPSAPVSRWFRLPSDWQVLIDNAGGYLFPERSIIAFLADARRCGPVDARRVVLATGAWATELLPALKPITHIERRVLHWFEDADKRFARSTGFRPFAISTGQDQLFYGFPTNRRGEVKVAEHRTLEVVSTPAAVDRTIRKADLSAIRPLVRAYMPGIGKYSRSEVCMYPMAAEERFILDRDPRDSRIIIGAGLSGHGFKFAPAIGEILAHLALGKRQKLDIKPFALADRLA